MKKTILLILAGLSFSVVQAQGISDAVRYAQDNINGTARFRAMGGAFGALGGDFSAITVNPAGSAIFANTQLGVSMSAHNTRNKSDYFGTKASESLTTFDLNQFGGALVFRNNFSKDSKWKKFVIAANYETTNNFDDARFTAGTNPNNSATGYFASVANGINVPVNVLEDSFYEQLTLREQIAFLGYQGYLINLDTGNANDDSYLTNVASGDFYQESYTETSGFNGKIAFNAAAEYNERLYFGLNINAHFTDYTKLTRFYEENDNSVTAGVRDFYYDTDLHTYGNGFSFQLGAIAKVTPSLRAGLSYESPTWYTLTDELLQSVYSTGYNFGNPPNPGLDSAYPDSEYLLIYDPYKLTTPAKWTGSLAYVFGKKGLLSLDYSIRDYSTTRFRPSDSFFNPTNQTIKNNLAIAGGLRLGGEYRIKKWSLRGGFRNEESPYKDKNVLGDLTAFSGGFGYSFGITRLDLSYAHSQRNSQQALFSEGFTDAPKIRTQNNDITLTILFDL